MFENMKAVRLKVYKDKTKLLIITNNQKRKAEGGLAVSMTMGGKIVKPENSAKSLGVIIGSDLSCWNKLAALRNIETLSSEVRKRNWQRP